MIDSVHTTDFPECISRNGCKSKVPLLTSRAKTLLAKKNKTKTLSTESRALSSDSPGTTTIVTQSLQVVSQARTQSASIRLQRAPRDSHVNDDMKDEELVNKERNDATDGVADRSHPLLNSCKQEKRGTWGRSWGSVRDLKVENDDDEDDQSPPPTRGGGRGHPALSRAIRSFRHLLVMTNVVDQDIASPPPRRGLRRTQSSVIHQR